MPLQKLDQRVSQTNECATDKCDEWPEYRFEQGGVGSYYCEGCALKILALADARASK